MKVALYPGAFKPPTKGHLSVVQRLLSGNYSTAKVDRETGKYEKISDNPKMDQVWILVGDMVKGGPGKSKGTKPEVAVDQDVSIKLWEVYLKSAGLTGKVKLYRAGEVRGKVNESETYSFLSEGANPVGDVYGLLKDKYIRDQYKDIEFFPVTGFRSDNPEALKDLKRMDYAKNKYPDLKVITILDEPQAGEETVSATKLRAAIYARDEKEIAKYAPGNPKDILALFPPTPEDKMEDSIDEIFNKFTDWDIDDYVEGFLKEGSGGTPIDAVAAIPSKDRAKMEEYLEYYQNLTPKGWNVSMKGMQIIIAMDKYSQGPQSYNNDYDNTPNQPSMDVSEGVGSFDFIPYIGSIIEHMLDQGMNILPLPDIKLRKDQAEAADIFGKTAYYNPAGREVVLFTLNRHPKDVLRSFCHEMIHHIQNVEDRLGNITTTNTQEDDHLAKIEQEAHYLGSITFRHWEDKVKQQMDSAEKAPLQEDLIQWLEEEDQALSELTNPDGEQFKYSEDPKLRHLYKYKDSKGNTFFLRLFFNSTAEPHLEVKVGWLDNKGTPVYNPPLPPDSTGIDNLKRRNTVAAIYKKEVLPFFESQSQFDTLKIKPISKKRYSFSKRMVENLTPSELKVLYSEDSITVKKVK